MLLRIGVGRMRLPLVVALLLAVLAMAAGAAPVTVERTVGALALEASLNARTFQAGEPVRITLVARNTGGSPLTLTFASGKQADIRIRRSRGDEVWFWSHDRAFTQAIQTLVLRPRESVTILSEAWNQRDLQGLRVDPGTYEAVVEFFGRIGEGGGVPIRLPPLPFAITR